MIIIEYYSEFLAILVGVLWRKLRRSVSFVAGCRATLLQHNYAAHIEQPAYEPTQIAVVHQLHLRLWQLRMRRSRIRIDVEPKLLLARFIQS